MRPALAPLALCAVLFAGPLAAGPPQAHEGANAFDRIELALQKRASSASSGSARKEAYVRLNQIRNHKAISEMLAELPAPLRPSRILYAASGDHMAPLVACVDDPGARPYSFLYTEVDTGVREGIDGFLKFLERQGVISKLSSGSPPPGKPGAYAWSFRLGRHPVTLTLVLNPREGQAEPSRLYPAWALEQSDMVITHDWAGDQQDNLRLVWELLQSVRTSRAEKAPLMMIEDLERHPYPVDLSFFSPLARTKRPYGHRESLPVQAGVPPGVELGTPLYGGAVVLGFTEGWWKGLDDTSLMCAFNFLLFNQFDDCRINVITGGTDPVLAPAILDWSTGFGYRAIDGQDVRRNRNIKPAMIERLPALAGTMPQGLQKRWACRMLLYRCLLELEAGGTDVDELFPSARFTRRLGDPSHTFPTPEVEAMAKEAQTHAEEYAMAQGREREVAAALARLAEASSFVAAVGPCLPADGSKLPGDKASWRALYRATLSSLDTPLPHPPAP